MIAPRIDGSTLARYTRFATVGASGLVVNSLMLVLMHGVLHVPIVLASTIAVELAIINNFYWNNSWTFQDRAHSRLVFLKFNSSCLGAMVITVLSTRFLIGFMHFHYLAAGIFSVFLAAGWNFTLSNSWTWRASKGLAGS